MPVFDSQRAELASIPESFQKNKGNYWIALFNEKVVGTIAVIDIGHDSLELRDVFLSRDLRGSLKGYSKLLLDTVFEWARARSIKTIYLGTTLGFKAAHKFYEKHGFKEISRSSMPVYCKPMDCDDKFYKFEF